MMLISVSALLHQRGEESFGKPRKPGPSLASCVLLTACSRDASWWLDFAGTLDYQTTITSSCSPLLSEKLFCGWFLYFLQVFSPNSLSQGGLPWWLDLKFSPLRSCTSLLPFSVVSPVPSVSHTPCIWMFVLFTFLIPLECRFHEGRDFVHDWIPSAWHRTGALCIGVGFSPLPQLFQCSRHNQSFKGLCEGMCYVKTAEMFLAFHSGDKYGLDHVT